MSVEKDTTYLLGAGYASCSDSARLFISASQENQIRWLEKSEQTIQQFIKNLSSFRNFREAYTFLAHKRHQIALELEQRAAEGRTEHYGSFREEGDHFRQTISAGDGEQFWKWQKNKVFELTYHLIEPVKKSNLLMTGKERAYEDEFIKCLTYHVAFDNEQATYYGVLIKSPFANESQLKTLSKIELFDFDLDMKSNLIRISYTPINQLDLEITNQITDHYFKLLLHWKKEDGIDVFLANSGRLAYLLAHLLLVRQGNVGITEWMLRGLAFHNGIALGYFNHAEGISWDFKAILTADLNEYVTWFCDKAFKNYTLLEPEQRELEFCFTR